MHWQCSILYEAITLNLNKECGDCYDLSDGKECTTDMIYKITPEGISTSYYFKQNHSMWPV